MAGVVQVSPKQEKNPVLRFVTAVAIQYNRDLKCDFLLGPGVEAVFISLRFHVLHPGYLDARVTELRKLCPQVIILCLIDIEDCSRVLQEVTLLGVAREATLLVGSTPQEIGRYIESFRTYEGTPTTAIQERRDTEHVPAVIDVLTSIRSVNKTDAMTLMATFPTLADIMTASPEALARCVGFGEKKVRRVYDHFHSPLSTMKE